MKGYILHFFNPLVGTLTPAKLTTGKDGNASLAYVLDGSKVERVVSEDVLPINLEIKNNKLFSKKTFLFIVAGDNFISLDKGIFKVIGTISQTAIKELTKSTDFLNLLYYIGSKQKDDWKGLILLAVVAAGGLYVLVKYIMPMMGVSVV